jgi:hypothetical protein
VEKRHVDLLGQRSALDDQLKRASTEVTRSRTLQSERKRLVGDLEAKEAEIQQELDEVERQRARLVERLLERREEREKAHRLVKEAGHSTDEAQHVIKQVADSKVSLAKQLEEAEREANHVRERLRESALRALNVHLLELERRLDQAFAGHEDRQRRLASLEAFKKARHDDRRIGDLCDQRDQFRELITMATVPAVKETLNAALKKIEDELERRYPGAMTIGDTVPEVSLVEDLHYYTDGDGKGCILLPISATVWSRIQEGDTGTACTRAMRLAWGLVKGTGLKPGDGQFCCIRDRCLFIGNFSGEELSILDAFSLTMPGSVKLDLRFVPLPTEVLEGVLHEVADP